MSEPTLQDKIIAAAEYDGWRKDEPFEESKGYLYNNRKYEHDNRTGGFCFEKDFTYHTSLDTIAPVALRVREQLRSLYFSNDTNFELGLMVGEINNKFKTLNANQIFSITYEAICLLKKYEK